MGRAYVRASCWWLPAWRRWPARACSSASARPRTQPRGEQAAGVARALEDSVGRAEGRARSGAGTRRRNSAASVGARAIAPTRVTFQDLVRDTRSGGTPTATAPPPSSSRTRWWSRRASIPRPPPTACAARAARREPRCTRSNQWCRPSGWRSAAIGCRASASRSRCSSAARSIGRCWPSWGPAPPPRWRCRTAAASGRRRARASWARSPARSSAARRRDCSLPPSADWTAAAVPVADRLWVLGIAHRSAGALPLAATVACGLAGLALALAGAIALVRRRRGRSTRPSTSKPARRRLWPAHRFRPPPRGRRRRSRRQARRRRCRLSPERAPRRRSAGGGPAAVAVATALAAEGGQQFGRYRLVERIGEGGMAEVFTAVLSGAEGFERVVVIKRLQATPGAEPGGGLAVHRRGQAGLRARRTRTS